MKKKFCHGLELLLQVHDGHTHKFDCCWTYHPILETGPKCCHLDYCFRGGHRLYQREFLPTIVPLGDHKLIDAQVMHVSSFGEVEFWLGAAKLLTMTTLILSTFVCAMDGGPNNLRSGFRYWKNPGAFAEYLVEVNKGKFLGWWACMVQACFTFTVSPSVHNKASWQTSYDRVLKSLE